MLDYIYNSFFDITAINSFEIIKFLTAMGCSLVMGLILACAYMIKTRYTRSFVATLAILPTVVCVVIMMVNGSIGAGVAVAGAFSLVRFRSVPGTAKEIGAIFIAMSTGLISGMGHFALAFVFVFILSIMMAIYNCMDFGMKRKNSKYKTLNITIPEDLDYTDVFKSIFSEYTSFSELIMVKTTNMGSLFKLTYEITLKNPKYEKLLIDELRCRNGNLEISISNQETRSNNL